MKNLLFFLASTVAYSYAAAAKKGTRTTYRQQQILPSPFNTPALLRTIQTHSGDIMQLGECKENGVTYGVINIQFKQAYTQLEDAEKVLSAFMNGLQPSFGIQHAVGYYTDTTGSSAEKKLVDYWQDFENLDWKVEGWTNGQALSVSYVKNIGALPVDLEEKILSHFRFMGA